LIVVKSNDIRSRVWKSVRRAAASLGVIACVVAGAIGIYCGVLQLIGNVHVVVEKQFYRSAQLDKTNLARVVQEYKIKSILNLLGTSQDKSWYVDEIAISEAFGVEHHDYGISASEFVDSTRIDEILKILRNAPKPILVHCKNGADRTGLVAAIYLAEIHGAAFDEASGQLSLYYGHFPWLTSESGAMDESFRSYEGRKLLTSTKTVIR
jgi:protein tyrosine phosphatase (PTP) superfamily phosphohydrolase (DUF442 family)